jgi:hypothetical protein
MGRLRGIKSKESPHLNISSTAKWDERDGVEQNDHESSDRRRITRHLDRVRGSATSIDAAVARASRCQHLGDTGAYTFASGSWSCIEVRAAEDRLATRKASAARAKPVGLWASTR